MLAAADRLARAVGQGPRDALRRGRAHLRRGRPEEGAQGLRRRRAGRQARRRVAVHQPSQDRASCATLQPGACAACTRPATALREPRPTAGRRPTAESARAAPCRRCRHRKSLPARRRPLARQRHWPSTAALRPKRCAAALELLRPDRCAGAASRLRASAAAPRPDAPYDRNDAAAGLGRDQRHRPGPARRRESR